MATDSIHGIFVASQNAANHEMHGRTGGPFSRQLASLSPVPRDFYRSPTQMIELTRTTRDVWWFALPILTIFTLLLTSIALAAYGLIPEFGTVYPAARWLAPPIAFVLWIILIWYVYRLLFPIQFYTRVFDDRVVFCTSRLTDDSITFKKGDVRQFLVLPSRWWHTDENLQVLSEANDGSRIKLSMNFVYADIAPQFFDAIAKMWGPEYVPGPREPTWLSKEIHLWPRRRSKEGEPGDARESPS